jgi:hypothetical protein
MSGTNQAYAPKLKDLRSIAIRWWFRFRGIQICIAMSKVVL